MESSLDTVFVCRECCEELASGEARCAKHPWMRAASTPRRQYRRFGCWTGPTLVQKCADVLRAAGASDILEGTETVYFRCWVNATEPFNSVGELYGRLWALGFGWLADARREDRSTL